MKSLTLLLIPCLLAINLQAHAGVDLSDPEQTMRLYYRHLHEKKYDAIGALMHPAALKEFRELADGIVKIDSSRRFITSFLDVATVEEYGALSDEAVYAKIVEKTIREFNKSSALFPLSKIKIIGTYTDEKDATAYVIYRFEMNIETIPMEKLSVEALRRHEGRWLLLLNGDIRGMINFLKLKMK